MAKQVFYLPPPCATDFVDLTEGLPAGERLRDPTENCSTLEVGTALVSQKTLQCKDNMNSTVDNTVLTKQSIFKHFIIAVLFELDQV